MAPSSPDAIGHTLLTLQSLYESYLAPTLPPPLNTMISSFLSGALTIQPYASGLFTQSNGLIGSLLSGNSDGASGSGVMSTILLVVTLYVSLKIMNYIRRSIMGWVFLAVKLVLLLVLVQVVIYVNTYGWEKTVRDAGWIGGMLWGFAEEALEGNTSQNKMPRGMRGRNTGGGKAKVPAGRSRWT